MPTPPLIALLGAPYTGIPELVLALRQRIAPGSAQIEEALPDEPLSATLTLLMGLDLPCPAEERTAQEAFDARLRATLERAGVPYQVVYGQGERRIANALNAIKNIAISEQPISASAVFDMENRPPTTRLRAWDCEKCSDPECEHRLFTSLVSHRSARSD
ncbi:hypothetical protein [Acidovorax sp.]|uniref:hypothetical protein n=1 Tax=Acidovorax sp. TaxID=1872122 RepID=UPI0026036640|nr:hypothetical protein [Acidovorax sp.]